LIDAFGVIPGALSQQVQVTKEAIDWATSDKRVFLKQALETRLAGLYVSLESSGDNVPKRQLILDGDRYLENKMYADSLSLIASLNKELKRLDDKNVLMEVQLLESRVHHATKNLPKARVCCGRSRCFGREESSDKPVAFCVRLH
jgi:26S proteasome regulatory subunit N6